MENLDDALLLTESDGSGHETAIATITDKRWVSGLVSYWRQDESPPADIGFIFREVGENLFFEQGPGGSRRIRLSRHLVWVSENAPRRYTYVARETCPHFRFVDGKVGSRRHREPAPVKGPPNIAVATHFVKGEASGNRSKPHAPQQARSKRLARMVSTLLQLIKEGGGHTATASPKHVDSQLASLSGAGANCTIGRLKCNPLSRLLRVQPTEHALDQLGQELWDESYKWSRHEKPHALVVVAGKLGPGKTVTWRSRAGQVRIVLPKRVARSSPRANRGPYLIAISLVRGPTPGSWRAERAGAVAIVSRTVLLPVDSRFERPVGKALLTLLSRLPEGAILEKPLPGQTITIGNRTILPDFVVRVGHLVTYIEVLGQTEPDYVSDKREDAKALQSIGHAITVDMVKAFSIPNGVETALSELADTIVGLVHGSNDTPLPTKVYSWWTPQDTAAQQSA